MELALHGDETEVSIPDLISQYDRFGEGLSGGIT
jgi:hypothetical protein